jgi:nucleoside-diphosphate-sugar epimerase
VPAFIYTSAIAAAGDQMAAGHPPVGRIVHVVDNEPMQLKVFARLLVDAVGGGRVIALPRPLVALLAGSALAAMLTGSYRSRNAGARDLLGWRPRHRRVVEGLPETLQAWAARSVKA